MELHFQAYLASSNEKYNNNEGWSATGEGNKIPTT